MCGLVIATKYTLQPHLRWESKDVKQRWWWWWAQSNTHDDDEDTPKPKTTKKTIASKAKTLLDSDNEEEQEESTKLYVKIHETEKNNFSLIATDKRCKLLEDAIKNIDVNTVTLKCFLLCYLYQINQ